MNSESHKQMNKILKECKEELKAAKVSLTQLRSIRRPGRGTKLDIEMVRQRIKSLERHIEELDFQLKG